MSIRYLIPILLIASGCGLDGLYADIPPYVPQQDDAGDVHHLDATPEDTSNPPDTACVPLTQCPDATCGEVNDGCGAVLQCGQPTTCAELGDVCGVHSDGCGGELDCGQCSCVDGEPQVERCGTCRFGQPSCSSDNAFSCDEPEWLTYTGEVACDRLLYVDLEAPDGGDGSIEAPFNGWVETSAAAREAVALDAILIAGSPVIESTLILPARASIIGGFDRTWHPDDAERPQFKPSNTFANIGMVGAYLIATHDITLAHMRITTGPAGGGENNYGLLIENSNDLHILDVTAEAAQGGTGSAGTNGMNGAMGNDGQDGDIYRSADGCGGNQDTCNLSRNAQSGVGQGGINDVCPTSSGGRGGRGSHECGTDQGGNSLAYPSEPGATSADLNLMGGLGGFLGSETGRDGQDAPSTGNAAPNGRGGTSSGLVNGNAWENTGDGVSGVDGRNGSGGSGGGGSHQSGYFFNNTSTNTEIEGGFGVAGAGGGAGGCGGTGGTGGQGGGASFGLLMIGSERVTLIDSAFEAAPGGKGGDGAQGGVGGLGGDGGVGADDTNAFHFYQNPNDQNDRSQYCDVISQGNRSGDGGDGADGQAGGAGGGGAGGVSYGAYCHDGKPTIQGQTTFRSLGSAQGGVSIGSPGGPGVSASEFGCY